jgi:hypothetical protein
VVDYWQGRRTWRQHHARQHNFGTRRNAAVAFGFRVLISVALVDLTSKLEQRPANSLTPQIPVVEPCATLMQIDLWLVNVLILEWHESWRVNKGRARISSSDPPMWFRILGLSLLGPLIFSPATHNSSSYIFSQKITDSCLGLNRA